MNHSAGPGGDEATSVQLRCAATGDIESLEWLVRRFTPLLLAQAHQRMGAELTAQVSHAEIVQDVWAVALPRLGELVARTGRATPVVVKFLSTVCALRIRSRARALRRDRERFGAGDGEPVAGLPAEQSDVVTRVAQRELIDRVRVAMDSLSPSDRELLVLRFLEQRSGAEVAAALGLESNAVYVRQHRALAVLRGVLEGELFAELERAAQPRGDRS